MKARLLLKRRIILGEGVFSELLLWQVPERVPGSLHDYKYSLALVANGDCVMRYDNETGKGDHRHYGRLQQPYIFVTLDKLLQDFEHDIERYLLEYRHTEGRPSE